MQQTKAVLTKRREMADIVDREKAAGRTIRWAGAKLLVRDGTSGNFRQVTSQGGREKLRIVSWNINGLLTKLADETFKEILNDFDIIFFNETWISKNNTLELDILGYKCVHVYGNKAHGVKKGRYSGGVAVYFRDSLTEKLNVVETNDLGLIWIKLHRELFCFDEHVYICNAYIPPINSKVHNRSEVNFFDDIEKGVELYSKDGQVYICGDLNSRTGDLVDYLDPDNFLKIDEMTEVYASIINRSNLDQVIDSNGHKLV